MGFNKCYLTKDRIQNTYKNDQFGGVEKLLRMYDAYITDEISSLIIDSYREGELTEELLNIYLYEKVKDSETI